MTEKTPPTLSDVRAVTPEQLTTMTPPEIDEMNAALSRECYRIDDERNRAWEHLYSAVGVEKEMQGRRWVWPLRRDEIEEQARTIVAAPPAAPPDHLKRYNPSLTVTRYVQEISGTLEKLNALDSETMKLNRSVRPKLEEEFQRRGGWSRFYLVNNANGHIHRSTSCTTLHVTTRITWLPELSGLSEENAVKAYGTILCSLCFPSAPVEWTLGNRKEDKPECPGSRKPLKPDKPRVRSKTAICPKCGVRVSVTSTWKARTHPPRIPRTD